MSGGRTAGPRGWVRIVGGSLRGRRLPVPELPGLRPTPDRVRETLFNWLAPEIEGARCLDLFAGTGALGLEAVSRGAARVLLVDRSPRIVAHLTALTAQLGVSDQVTCARADGLELLARTPDRFDVVFLDPPFGAGLLVPACGRLAERGLVAPGGTVYLETELDAADLALPPGWALHRSGRAGDVRYYLARPGAP